MKENRLNTNLNCAQFFPFYQIQTYVKKKKVEKVEAKKTSNSTWFLHIQMPQKKKKEDDDLETSLHKSRGLLELGSNSSTDGSISNRCQHNVLGLLVKCHHNCS